MLTELVISSIGLSLFSIYQNYLLNKYTDSQDTLIENLKKDIYKLQVNNKEQIYKCEEAISNLKTKIVSDNSDLKNKVKTLERKWVIVADDRITSIPTTNKEWYEAEQVVAQPKLKEWKPKNLSQSKSSFVNTNPVSDENEDEVNQDFSQLSDEDFEDIIDDDEDDSSSDSTSNTQARKPKPKKPMKR